MAANQRARRLLDGLNQAQAEAVTVAVSDTGPVVVLAGAGSGKTRVLTRRLAYQVMTGAIDPSRVLTLTFTRKAASELHQRIRALGLREPVPAGTFHGLALQQLRQRWIERGIAPPTLINRRTRLLRQLLANHDGANVFDVMHEIDWARARLIEPEQYAESTVAAGRRTPLPPAQMAELMVRFQQEKRRRRVVDFDDLLALAYRDLQADPDYAAAVRWRHRHFFVDEFQDVNPLQHALLREWVGDRTDLFVVGDPNQAIYGWNGADPQLLNDLATESTSTVIRLTDNYRSSPQVLRVAEAVLGRPDPQPRGPGDRAAMVAHRPAGPLPYLTRHDSDADEAAHIASTVRATKEADRPWADQAVLVRTNAQLVLIEQALAQLGVPARVRSGLGPLASPEVRDELKQLSSDGVDLISYLEELDDRLAALQQRAGQPGPETERHQNLSAFASLVHEYVTGGSGSQGSSNPTGPGLVAWVNTLGDGDVADGTDAVELATFHGAKGLEWPVVHLAGLEDGFVPISYASTGLQRAEERRLLYVAITRAEHQLHLNWAASRSFGLSTVRREPSPYVSALHTAIDGLRGSEARPVDWRAQIERSRRRLPANASAADNEPGRTRTSGSPSDDDLRRTLERWRATKARAAGVPAHVILDDRTLQSVSDHRPSTRAALASLTGIRPVKLARYGDDLLQLVDEAIPEKRR
jgi:DNA helicase-2/ATP-dependent DNA helicase PcrA